MSVRLFCSGMEIFMKIKKVGKQIAVGVLCATLASSGITTPCMASAGTQININDGEQKVMVDSSAYILQSGGLLSEDQSAPTQSELSKASSNMQEAIESVRDALDNLQTNCDISKYNISLDDLSALYSTVINTTPRFFYVNSGFRYSYSGNIATRITFDYKYDKTTIASKKSEYEGVVKSIIAGVNPKWTDMEKALYLHDYIVDNCEYDLTYSNYDAYNVFVQNTAVCQGYSLAYKELMDRVGIPCQLVTSTSVNHAWNILSINNNNYYVDATWDDPTKDLVGRVKHTNFLKSYENFASSKHYKNQDWVITENWSYDCANDTRYDSSFFDQVNTGFRYVGNYWYAIEGNAINKYQYNNNNWENEGTLYTINDRWSSSEGGYWIGTFSGLSLYRGVLYFAGPENIYSINPVTQSDRVIVRTLTDEEKAIGYIYGIHVAKNGDIRCELSKSPNQDGTVIVAGSLYSSEPCETHDFYDENNEPILKKCVYCDTNNINYSGITVEGLEMEYSGYIQTPAIILKNENGQTISSDNYTVDVTPQKNVSDTYSLTITGKGKYAGERTETWKIEQATPDIGAVTYNGEAQLFDTMNIDSVTLTREKTGIAGILAITSGGKLIAGTNSYNWKFIPADDGYKAITGTVELTVIKNELSELTFTSGSLGKTEYTYGDLLDFGNVVLTATYKNGDTETIDNSMLTYDALQAGDTSAVISYKVGHITKTYTFDGITVAKAATHIKAPTGLKGSCGNTLSTVEFTDSHFSWKNDAITMTVDADSENEKINTYVAVYTPTDIKNYETVEVNVFVEVAHTPKAAVKEDEVTPSCEKAGSYNEVIYCSGCNIKLSSTPKTIAVLGHNTNTEVKNAKEATCTNLGYTGDTYCKDCGKKIEDGKEIAKKAHTPVTDKAVAAKCGETGLTEGSHCRVCNEVLVAQETTKALTHMWNSGKITKAATVMATGVKTYTCTLCKANKKVTIAKLKPTIKLSKTSVTLKKGKTATIKVSKLAKGDAVKSWTTDKKKVAIVDKKGKIKAVKKGKATITVTLKSGKKAIVKVTVK